ncbi:hypothetical protein [Planococcus beigongshangi]|uniref:hypothetical protein n=1 Tax=Planococcus beigongshangi TaxID=2782536 RepID=UPI00193BACF0|nr:hypothetical protein [Planococcus beigongshangi]
MNTSFNRGNFSRAQANAVQDKLNEAFALANALPNGDVKTEFLAELNGLQANLDAAIEARYVYYDVLEEGTSLETLKLSISTSIFNTANGRTQDNKPVYVQSGGEANVLYLRYIKNSLVLPPAAGDTVTLNLRFRDNVKNIDVTFTNLGNGNWDIESDWLVEAQ